MRKPYLAGNWKMNLDRRAGRELCTALSERLGQRFDVDVAVFPPFVYIDELRKALVASPIRVGAQNCSDQPSGAFTGEVSAAMLADVGAEVVLVGHSERRHVYGEGDELVNHKLHAVLEAGLDAILCVGETLEQREAGRTEEVTSHQLMRALEGIASVEMERVTVAYEPVWAIGTGQVATPKQAAEAHAYIRGVLGGLLAGAGNDGSTAADSVRILYGGSVNPGNVRELMAVPDVDGTLVGGASLKAETFIPILEYDR